MDYLSFLKQQFFDITPRIEGELEGLWRLEESWRFDFSGTKRICVRDAGDPEAPCISFAGSLAALVSDCTFCTEGEEYPCRSYRDPEFDRIEFDLHDGMLVCNGAYFRVEQLAGDKLVLLNLVAINQGVAIRSHYRREN